MATYYSTITYNAGGYTTASTWAEATTTGATYRMPNTATSTISWSDVPDGLPITITRIPDTLPAGNRTIKMPDGAKLHIDDLGNYRIEDDDAKVVYRANRMREFSPHLNASDMLAKFVEYAGSVGVKRSDVMGLSIELFLAWLIIEAAERDGDPIPDDVAPPDVELRRIVHPKCLACGKFIPRLHARHRFPFCDPDHARRHGERQRLLIAG